MINSQPTSPTPAGPPGLNPVTPQPTPITSNTIPQQPAPEAFNPASQPQAETVVIPTGFEPQTQPSVVPPDVTSKPKSGGGCGRIIMILFILIILGGVGFGGWYFWSKLGGGGPVNLTYWGLWENDANIAPVIADFEAANPNIHVEYTKQSQKQYRERLAAAIQRGDGPDVFRFHNTWVAMLKDDLSPVPASVMTPSDFTNTYYPVAKNDLIAGSTIYGLPMEIDGLGLYINEDLFAAAGVTQPVTWEDVLSIVPKLTVKNQDTLTTSGIALGVTSNVENWSDILATMMLQNGVQLANPVGQQAEEALLFFHKFADPADPVYTWNANFDNSISAFANGRVAMILAPSWRAFDIKQMNPNLNFRISPIPQLSGNSVNWASYWVEGVSNKSKHTDAAWKFVNFLTSHDSVVKIYTQATKSRLFGEPYARKDLAATLSGDQFVDVYVKEAANAVSFPLASNTYDNGLNDQMIKYLEDAVNGLSSGGSPTALLTTVAQGFSQVLARYGLVSATAPAGH